MRLIVPTAVRVEAGWDRSNAKAAAISRLRVHDGVLDGAAADVAARARARLAVTVADGHVAAVLRATPAPHAVMTSDVGDLRRVAHHMRADVTTVHV